MKLNKLISKGLALGFLLNSASTLSYANTEIPNRYQTLEGEYITIDDSTEGNLEEIEIFGNTIQDESNLEDIQSVGDLYVDGNGNPILDSQGREQYKINIKSYDYMFQNQLANPDISTYPFTNSTVDDKWNTFKWNIGDYKISRKNAYSPETLSTLNKDKIYVRFDIIKMNDTYYNGEHFASRDGGYRMVYMSQSEYNSLTVGKEYTHSVISEYWGPDDYESLNLSFGAYDRNIECEFKIKEPILINLTKLYGKGNEPSKEWCDANIPYILDNNFYYNNLSDINILLPTQLQKVGDVADRLYWDGSQGRYIIEKNIDKIILDGSEKWGVYHVITGDERNPYLLRDDNLFSRFPFGYTEAISNLARNEQRHSWHSTDRWFKYFDYDGIKSVGINIEVSYTEVSMNNIESFKNFLSQRNMTIYLPLSSSELIKTNITSKLKIPTYDEKTHIYVETENGINPTLKVIVDRLPQIAKEAIAQAESDNSNHNIALARMYINMLPESSYKDELQTQLSDIFSSDMVLDSKTATSNLDVYIKCENILQMSLDTNQISFDDFSGIEDVEKLNAVNITINSSLPYQINAYLPSEIQNSDKTKTLDKSILNIKESSSNDYQTFSNINEKVVLKDNCSAGNQLTHGVDLKLAGGIAHEKDVYKAIIKLEAEQK